MSTSSTKHNSSPPLDFEWKKEVTHTDPIKQSLQVLYKVSYRAELTDMEWQYRSGENLVLGYFQFTAWLDRFLMQSEVLKIADASPEQMKQVIDTKNRIRSEMDRVITRLTYNEIGSSMIIPKGIISGLAAVSEKIKRREGTPKENWEELDALNRKIERILKAADRSWR